MWCFCSEPLALDRITSHRWAQKSRMDTSSLITDGRQWNFSTHAARKFGGAASHTKKLRCSIHTKFMHVPLHTGTFQRHTELTLSFQTPLLVHASFSVSWSGNTICPLQHRVVSFCPPPVTDRQDNNLTSFMKIEDNSFTAYPWTPIQTSSAKQWIDNDFPKSLCSNLQGHNYW